jgi:hypothetical protein
VLWGILLGLYFIPLIFFGSDTERSKIVAEGRLLPSGREAMQMSVTFAAVVLAWIFFRAPSLSQALGYLSALISHPWLEMPHARLPLVLSAVLLAVEWLRREKEYVLQIESWPLPLRWSLYGAITLSILVFSSYDTASFLYTQF